MDRRLFDVSALIRNGVDDRSTASLPLIVQYKTGLARPNAAALGGAKVKRDLPAVHGAALSAAKNRASTAWSGFVSMRAFGSDTAGNTFAQTIIHLYKLR